MTEPEFTILINPMMKYTQNPRVQELRTRRNCLILNGERFKYNAIIKQIQKEKRKTEYQKNLDMLNLLLS